MTTPTDSKNALSITPPRRGLPLRVTILTLISALLIATVGVIEIVGFATTSSSHRDLKHRFLDASVHAVQKRVRLHIERAEPILHHLEVLAEAGLERMDDPERIAHQLALQLRYEQGVMFLSYARRTDGLYVGARRNPNGTIDAIISAPESGMLHEFDLTEAGTLDNRRAMPDAFDPRVRGWYLAGLAARDIVWTEPYDYALSTARGITASVPHIMPGDPEPVGVFGVDFALGDIETFLAGVDLSKNGQILVYLHDATLLAGSHRDPTHPTALVAGAVLEQGFVDPETLSASAPLKLTHTHEGARYAVAALAFDVPGEPHWFTMMITPEAELLGVAQHNLMIALGVGSAALLLALWMGYLLSGRIAAPLSAISREMERIGEFDLSAAPTPKSFVKEIAVVADSADRMKAGLRSFVRYVPHDVVRSIIQSGEEIRLGGQMRELTMHFSDLEGFTSWSESLPPDEVVAQLAEYLEVVADSQREQHGTVVQFAGDGVFAFFNAPAPVSDHAEAACRAALLAEQRLEEINARRTARELPEFHSRVGLHTAHVLVGNVGTESRYAYTAMGDGVNLAARLESINKMYGTRVIASETTREQTGDRFHWRTLDNVAVVGRSSGTIIHELLGFSGEVEQARLDRAEAYERALRLYFEGDFAAAASLFERMIKTHADAASREMLRRCRRFMIEAPSSWEGVFALHSK